jgi:hypothetical protein
LLPALLVATASAQAGGDGADTAWHRGRFVGAFDQMRVIVTCESQRACEYTFSAADASAKLVLRRRADDVAPVDAVIPNNNLAHTRDAVAANPALYAGREGPPLAALRPLLESPARYRQCVGGADGDWGPLCQLDTATPGLPDAVLLVPTMNATCNGQPFCAYFAIPLRRQPG